MNVLEKILEEIKEMRDIMKSTVATNCFGKDCEHDDCTVCVCERAMEIIRSHMDEAKDTNALSNASWIPVEERLPESDGFYLATLDGEICGQKEAFAGLAEFEHGKWIDNEEGYKCVLAWQPLPEPYKGE